MEEKKPQSQWKTHLQRWTVNTLAVLIASNVVKGIEYDTVEGLLVASLLLGMLNTFLRPVLLLLSLPLLILSLGLFILVINALLLLFVSWLVEPFRVDGFGPAFWGALIISLVSLIANIFTGTGDSRVSFRRTRKKPQPPQRDDGQGPIIDV
ncbi:MAG: phage holin family protein [Pedosphaera sp.]|nr:phage holin family protein [Pedosphaera sp.]MSS99841.1 phage holin family protein [Pedosphaera sp.]